MNDYFNYSMTDIKYRKQWWENRTFWEIFILKDGFEMHKRNDEYHRDGDEPAIIHPNGDKDWYKNGKYHRDGDKPARWHKNGRKEWYKNGERHRDGDKPAFIWENGDRDWYKNGKRHRDGDKPAGISVSALGDKMLCYYKKGVRHRDGDKPAFIGFDGEKEYWEYGSRVR